ncbi:MAG: glycoside hydrolase family 73 protein [Carnobacterium sp.]|uniref:glycoside hydrolase family 73 protein n=1 Tax=Carnobacterium sp. TaxID=48221 RepID=UPI0025799122|nr:glycoside hydrolase family 73 protein [Carnobacterium sp.]MBQ6484816.1 glycoside hydrolase family 73 protein [Carnobacterium sp.]
MVLKKGNKNLKKLKSIKIIPSYLVASIFISCLVFFGTLSFLSSRENGQQAQVAVEIDQEQAFIDKISAYAKVLQSEYGVLPSISIAQAILESNWGNSELSEKYNNFYGIKGSEEANTVLMNTKEFVDEEWIEINGRFRIYESWQDSMNAHTKLFVEGTTWNPQQYAAVLAADNYRDAAFALQASGYATDPTYPEKLIELIQQYKLDQFDK